MSAGVLNQLSFKKESIWGTAVVPDKSIPVRMSGGINTDNGMVFSNSARAILAKNQQSALGARTHEGDFEFDLFPDFPVYFMASAMGTCNSAVKETTAYNHTITESEAKMSMTIEQVVGENVRRYAGAIATGFKISGKTGELLTFSTSIKAKSSASATKISPTYLTNRALNFNDVAISVGGSVLTEITSFEVEYKNNVEYLHAMAASNDPAFSYTKASEITGKLELYLDSTSLAELTSALLGTKRAIIFTITGATIGATSNDMIVLTIPTAAITAQTTELGEDYNLLTLEFSGVYDPSTSKLLSLVVTNLLTALS
jgi:hypothetical protein